MSIICEYSGPNQATAYFEGLKLRIMFGAINVNDIVIALVGKYRVRREVVVELTAKLSSYVHAVTALDIIARCKDLSDESRNTLATYIMWAGITVEYGAFYCELI